MKIGDDRDVLRDLRISLGSGFTIRTCSYINRRTYFVLYSILSRLIGTKQFYFCLLSFFVCLFFLFFFVFTPSGSSQKNYGKQNIENVPSQHIFEKTSSKL